VDLAWVKGDTRLAEEHAARAFSLAVKTRSPYVWVHALACRGLSHVVAKRWKAATEDLAEALAFSRERKAGLEIEARVLADLSNAYYLSGDLQRAADTASVALGVARARAARVAECHAHIVMAYVLLASGERMDRVADEVRQAQSLMELTGAAIYHHLIGALNIRTSGLGGEVGNVKQRR